VQHADRVEVVGRDRDFRVVDADPAMRIDKARHGEAFGDVLGVVPVVEFVLGDVGKLHRRDQQPFRHRFLPHLNDCR
jgi:hypothetical protein